MHLKDFTYKVKGSRSENCVLINTENWFVNDSNMIVEFNSRGGVSNTFITEVLAENLTKYAGEVKTGDVILITAVAAKLYGARPFSIPIDLDSTKYTDIPFIHIIGKFDKKISFDSLHLLGDFLLLERLKGVDESENGFCVTTEYTNSVYKVVKKASAVNDVANYVLAKDNVATPIMLNGIQYYAISFKDVIAGFDVDAGEYTVENISTVYNHYLVLEDSQTQYANEGDTIFKATFHLDEQEWLSESYNENRFKVVLSGQPEFKAGDILYIIREALEYCTFRGVKYYAVNNKKFIMAKIDI